MSTSKGKHPCPPGCVPRSEVGLRLRETHYILGKDDPEYMSEYRYEYYPKKSYYLNQTCIQLPHKKIKISKMIKINT